MKKIAIISLVLAANMYGANKDASANISLHLLALPKVQQYLSSPASQSSSSLASPCSAASPLSPSASPDSPVNGSTTVDTDSGLIIKITPTTEKKETK